MIEIITGDLLDSKEKYIAHQVNCLSTGGAAGIARVIFDKYPHADTYINRTEKDIPGNIIIRGNGLDKRYIINLCSQYYPGGWYDGEIDNQKAREKYFHQCLLKIAKIQNLESIAFNFRVGCGIAGGDWIYYYGCLEIFEKFLNDKYGTIVKIYRREGDE